MNNIQQKHIIVVIGMHRSGTSVITRSLNVIGVDLGSHLIAGIQGDNDKGFFEDIDINALNNELLIKAGHDWHTLTPILPEELTAPETSDLKLRAVELLRKRLSTTDCLGIKDPRIGRLLPFWQDVFAHLKVSVSYVIASRNPMSVARSLAKRDGFDLIKSYYLWIEHMVQCLEQTENNRRIVVDYDLLMEDPAAQLKRMAQNLGLDFDHDYHEFEEYRNQFLEGSLRHTQYQLEDLDLDKSIPLSVKELYKKLRELSEDKIQFDSHEIVFLVKRISSELRDNYPALCYMRACEEKTAELFHQLSEIGDQITKINQTLSEREDQITKINQKLSEREDQITKINQTLSEREDQITKINQTLSEREGQITKVNQALSEREEQNRNLRQELEILKNEFDRIIRSKSWIITKPIRFLRRCLISRPYCFSRKMFSEFSHWCWHHLPASTQNKQKFKSSLFGNFPFIFSWTQAYHNWRNFNAPMRVGSFDNKPQIYLQMSQSSMIDNEYIPFWETQLLFHKPVKLICFYLPQFHPIPENNAWWGEDFTEWTNVKSAEPQFVGHYQPHVPGELGYYNLLDIEVQRRQVELARLYGIEGFCFYFYWFGSKRLLETPIENFLHDTGLDISFCLCWANENWSRRWDGLDSEVLIAQKHSPEDDLAFIRHISRYMRDPRYIRIGGRPLLLVYRPSLLPSAKETAQRWRIWCRGNGIGEIYLAYTQSFEAVDPRRYGFDAAVEFPPNNSAPPDITGSVTSLKENFACTVYDWQVFVDRSENYKKPNYKLFRSVCPSWDNTARRNNLGTVFLKNNPLLYQRWLENAIKDTENRFGSFDERLVFINAWNEWAEGAYLEPDERYGYAWLNATRNALCGEKSDHFERKKTIVLVAHDAYPHGAQMLSLNLAKTLHLDFGFHVDLVCMGDGPLKFEYAKWATLHDFAGLNPRGKKAVQLAKKLYDAGNRSAFVNTTVSGYFLQTLVESGFICVALIHELKGVLNQLELHEQAKAIATQTNYAVFATTEVATAFREFTNIDPNKVVIRPQGLYKRKKNDHGRNHERSLLRKKLDLPNDSQIILGVGYADRRKGIDLFVEAGLKLAKRLPKARWVWIGHWDQTMKCEIEIRLEKYPEIENRFIFPGLQNDTDLFYGGADVFALTSREDPFPSVMLEAFDAKIPVVGFEGAGGFTDLMDEGCGKLVAEGDTNAFAGAVFDILENPHISEVMGRCGHNLIKERFSFRHYVYDLLELSNEAPERVSVVVPNFNYAKYLPARLSSIVKQNYPIFEIIFLDDASTDTSVSVAEEILKSQPIDYNIVVNRVNSGSVFSQWKKGIELAKGEKIWIAEADDYADNKFLESVMKGFKRDGVVIAYTQSKQIDGTDRILCSDYLDYVKDVSPLKWIKSYYNGGSKEIIEGLSVKNTIPNVSAVVFQREPLKEVLVELMDKILSFRVAGDWFLYVNMLKKGDIYYDARPLNFHRRHNRSVTLKNFDLEELNEIARMQYFVSNQFVLPVEYQRKARDYLETLINQFSMQNRYDSQTLKTSITVEK